MSGTHAGEEHEPVKSGYEALYASLLRRVDAERTHQLALAALSRATALPGGLNTLHRGVPEPDERLRLNVWGLPFANPLGVAAGLDKNGQAIDALHALGFGHVEIGTVTLLPQAGNERPRVWRVIEQAGVINAMGFPNDGAAAIRARRLSRHPRGVVGVNIGKNRDTPLASAGDDYTALVAALFDVAHYFTVNVSSPNTPGLRSLQLASELEELLRRVQQTNIDVAGLAARDPKPILVKLSPDLADEELAAVAEAVVAGGANGVVATNTTTRRDGLPARYADLPGGLSGAPLRERANQVVTLLYRALGGRLPIVGVGGIASGADALERIRAGATFVQLYTAFTYAGPGLPARILADLTFDADENGWNHISELVGIDAA